MPLMRTFRLMNCVAVDSATNGIFVNNVIDLSDGENLMSHAEKAAAALKSGHLISVPTDTIYGIAALAQDKRAIENIYKIKKRSLAKPLAICVSEIDDVYLWGKVTVPYSLLATLLPGPVTVVFQRMPQLNAELNPGTELVGIRIPDHKFIRSVVRCCGSPLALTSANISSHESPLNIHEFQELWGKLHTVFDGGCLGGNELACREGSTVVDLSQPGTYRLVRRGSAFKQTVDTLNRYELSMIN